MLVGFEGARPDVVRVDKVKLVWWWFQFFPFESTTDKGLQGPSKTPSIRSIHTGGMRPLFSKQKHIPRSGPDEDGDDQEHARERGGETGAHCLKDHAQRHVHRDENGQRPQGAGALLQPVWRRPAVGHGVRKSAQAWLMTTYLIDDGRGRAIERWRIEIDILLPPIRGGSYAHAVAVHSSRRLVSIAL